MWFPASLAVAPPNSVQCSSLQLAIPRRMKMNVRLACQAPPHEFACGISLSVSSIDESFSSFVPSENRTFLCPDCGNEQAKPPVAEQGPHATPARPASEVPATVEPPAPAKPEPAPALATQLPMPKVQHARIVGTQESSILFDNFTAFITAIDGRKIAVGRDGWNVPLEIETGHRTLNVEFNRGVFLAKGRLEFDAVANARYELKFNTDAEVFGNNSYCNFWVIDTATGKTVSMISKDSVEKIAEAAAR
jgi:hypothetical protein